MNDMTQDSEKQLPKGCFLGFFVLMQIGRYFDQRSNPLLCMASNLFQLKKFSYPPAF